MKPFARALFDKSNQFSTRSPFTDKTNLYIPGAVAYTDMCFHMRDLCINFGLKNHNDFIHSLPYISPNGTKLERSNSSLNRFLRNYNRGIKSFCDFRNAIDVDPNVLKRLGYKEVEDRVVDSVPENKVGEIKVVPTSQQVEVDDNRWRAVEKAKDDLLKEYQGKQRTAVEKAVTTFLNSCKKLSDETSGERLSLKFDEIRTTFSDTMRPHVFSPHRHYLFSAFIVAVFTVLGVILGSLIPAGSAPGLALGYKTGGAVAGCVSGFFVNKMTKPEAKPLPALDIAGKLIIETRKQVFP